MRPCFGANLGFLAAGASAADLRHRAARPHEPALVDAVLQLLVADGPADQRAEVVVGRAGAQRLLQVPLATGEEARPELPVRRQPNPVAGRAERLRNRVDEAHLAGAVLEA